MWPTIVLITLYFAEFLMLVVITAVYYYYRPNPILLNDESLELQTGGNRPRDVANLLATAAYLPALVSLVLLEKLNDFSQLTWDKPDQGWTAFGFGQIFAVVTTMGPFIEIIRYLFRRTARLSGRSPISYILLATNFHLRT